MAKICDAVFEGGGMRGIGYVGAIHEFERQGYRFHNVAGSSAGAIIASLLAAGYNAVELRDIMSNVNFENFKHANNWYDNMGIVGKLFSVTRNFGIYSADLFEKWLAGLLAAKGVRTFADVGGRLKMLATDITDSRLLILPTDLVKFGIKPETFSVAAAVRMSMSIPLFYEPYELRDEHGCVHHIADGGILCNYPVWLLDTGRNKPANPIFGFRFAKTPASPKRECPKLNLFKYLQRTIETVMDDEDVYLPLIRGDQQRTTYIDTNVGGKSVGLTDFSLPRPQIDGLFENGRAAASQFLQMWNFDMWKDAHRA